MIATMFLGAEENSGKFLMQKANAAQTGTTKINAETRY